MILLNTRKPHVFGQFEPLIPIIPSGEIVIIDNDALTFFYYK